MPAWFWYALNNPIDQQAILAKRQETLQALYKLRFLSDVDDDFSQLEFEGEMRKIKTFRLKMQRLQEKEDVDRGARERIRPLFPSSTLLF